MVGVCTIHLAIPSTYEPALLGLFDTAPMAIVVMIQASNVSVSIYLLA
jgi:hypothetical protein